MILGSRAEDTSFTEIVDQLLKIVGRPLTVRWHVGQTLI